MTEPSRGAPAPARHRPDPLPRRLAAGGQFLGALLRMPDEALVEMCGLAGLDFIVLDTEHGPADGSALAQHLRAADAAGLPALVRVGDVTGSEVLRALDLGASGIVAPHVDDATAARAVVEAVRHPPRGRRGYARYTRAGDYGFADATDHAARLDAATLVVVMVESRRAVQEVDAVLSVDGVDAVFVGPADLAHDLAVGPDLDLDVDIAGAVALVRMAAERAGRSLMAIVSTPEAAAAELRAGTQLVVYNLQAALVDLLSALAAVSPGGRP